MENKQNNDTNVDSIQTRISVIVFQESKKFVAYSPAIDLSTCGNTEEQARKRFVEAASIFFSEIKSKGTTEEVLAECGWCKQPGEQNWQPPRYMSCTEELIPIFQGPK
jgi:hypothetical protein